MQNGGAHLFSIAPFGLTNTNGFSGFTTVYSPLLSPDDQVLYQVNGSSEIQTYQVSDPGNLTPLGPALPVGLLGAPTSIGLHLTSDGDQLLVVEETRITTLIIDASGVPMTPAAPALEFPEVLAATVDGSTLFVLESSEPPGSPTPALNRISIYSLPAGGQPVLLSTTPFDSTPRRILEFLDI